MNKNKRSGNLGSRGQNFNAGEGRRAGQQPKSANKPNRSAGTRGSRSDEDET